MYIPITNMNTDHKYIHINKPITNSCAPITNLYIPILSGCGNNVKIFFLSAGAYLVTQHAESNITNFSGNTVWRRFVFVLSSTLVVGSNSTQGIGVTLHSFVYIVQYKGRSITMGCFTRQRVLLSVCSIRNWKRKISRLINKRKGCRSINNYKDSGGGGDGCNYDNRAMIFMITLS